MTISYSKKFIKQTKRLDPSLRQKLIDKIELFKTNPTDPELRNHALRGKHKDYRSIDITGDVRALYLYENSNAIFDKVGTHSQLYG